MSGVAPGRAEAPSLADAIALYHAQRIAEACAAIAEVLARNPADVASHHAHGVILEAAGDAAAAAEAYRAAIARDPRFAPAWINLGRLADLQGATDDAARCYDRALMIDGSNALALANLGELFDRRGDMATASALLEAAHATDPALPEAAFNLGRVRLAEQHHDEAHRLLAIAAERATPARTAYADAFLLSALCHPDLDRERLQALHRDWGSRFAAHRGAGDLGPPRHRADASGRSLVVGLLSGDFNGHPASRFLEPLFAHHDRTRVELVAYHTLAEEDATTARLRAAAGRWRSIADWPAERIVRQIETDRVDILIDLSGHTRGSRFDVLAHHPAPLQGEWLGYLHASGLPCTDFRLVDPLMEDDEDLAVPLRDGIWCYAPYADAPPIDPFRTAGPMRFGSFNNPMKVNDAVLACWARLLRTVPESTLTLGGFKHAEGRASVASLMREHGIAAERLIFLPKLPVEEYLRAVNGVDLALDPFPYGGGTTTFDSLWMGTPVVTLAGDRECGRGTSAILSRLGLAHFVARDLDQYVEIAARNRPAASHLQDRLCLREKLAASPLMDGARFARSFEDTLHRTWKEHT